jgi:hypothetical protein
LARRHTSQRRLEPSPRHARLCASRHHHRFSVLMRWVAAAAIPSRIAKSQSGELPRPSFIAHCTFVFEFGSLACELIVCCQSAQTNRFRVIRISECLSLSALRCGSPLRFCPSFPASVSFRRTSGRILYSRCDSLWSRPKYPLPEGQSLFPLQSFSLAFIDHICMVRDHVCSQFLIHRHYRHSQTQLIAIRIIGTFREG